jgi:carbon storage regulator
LLVLTRKVGEAISIGEDVKITVIQVKGKQVRLGIKAGPNTMVHREEVFQRIQDENQSASQSSPENVSAGVSVAKSAGLKSNQLPGGQHLLKRRVRISAPLAGDDDE